MTDSSAANLAFPITEIAEPALTAFLTDRDEPIVKKSATDMALPNREKLLTLNELDKMV
jgi:hypothetical protein